MRSLVLLSSSSFYLLLLTHHSGVLGFWGFDGSLMDERSLAEASLVEAIDREDTGDENRDPAESIFSFI